MLPHSTNLLIEMAERNDDEKYLDRKLEQECDSFNERSGTININIRFKKSNFKGERFIC